MKLRQSTLTLSLLFLCVFLSAQDEVERKKQHEFGLNITSLAKNFIAFNSENLDPVPYVFKYKFINTNSQTNKVNAMRLALGLNVSQNIINEGFLTLKEKTTNLFFIWGFERQHRISKRWGLISGFDIVSSFDRTKIFEINPFSSEEERELSQIKTFRFGCGPFIGMQFFINDRITLTTESTLYLFYKNEENNFANNLPFPISEPLGDDVSSSGFEAVLEAPVAIFMHFRF